MSAQSSQLATFYVAGEMFGVDVREVQEVLLEQEATPVPLAPAHVVGLANLRGQIMPTFSLRLRFGIPAREAGGPVVNLVVKTDEGPVSIVVDEIGDVLEVPASEYREVPETVDSVQRQFVKNIFLGEGRLILALNLARVIDDDAKNATDAAH